MLVPADQRVTVNLFLCAGVLFLAEALHLDQGVDHVLRVHLDILAVLDEHVDHVVTLYHLIQVDLVLGDFLVVF